ncbi:MAG: hydrolase of the alpha/beta superfamily [Candidatus Eremiobacteraeota bacterium]|nr:hydrolase of the alpha/beta superfamily [Candidatus Eremiobacteraeota bacterium]
MRYGLASLGIAAVLVAVSAALMPAAGAAGCEPATAFVGTVCTPGTPGTHAAVIVLGGSGGGDGLARVASRFAKNGYVAASVAYFGAAGLPRTLDEIPVETVGSALDAIASRPDVDPARIALFGDSKGGELALLAASQYPVVRAVVGVVPSPFAWSGAGGGSSWTVHGKPVPYVALQRLGRGTRDGSAPDMRAVYAASMQQHRAAIPSAMFNLENVRGPILLLAGDADGVWDSPAQCRLGIDYLKAHAHPYADECVTYPDAGHAFLFATPQRPLVTGARGGGVFGGTARGNVAAGEQAWTKIDDFLTHALGP